MFLPCKGLVFMAVVDFQAGFYKDPFARFAKMGREAVERRLISGDMPEEVRDPAQLWLDLKSELGARF
jgi:hypothetical protein